MPFYDFCTLARANSHHTGCPTTLGLSGGEDPEKVLRAGPLSPGLHLAVVPTCFLHPRGLPEGAGAQTINVLVIWHARAEPSSSLPFLLNW